MPIKTQIELFLRPKGKFSFLSLLPKNPTILDVGCGNSSPYKIKNFLKNCTYFGVDIQDYNQVKPIIADTYIIVNPIDFANKLYELPVIFDAVISSHNIEHCNNPSSTLLAMMHVLKFGGLIYISFPSAKSIAFPSRSGTLNYFDDGTHKSNPPDFDSIIKTLQNNGFEIMFSARNYQPLFLYILGFLLEPLSHFRGKIMRGTWEYYGFESIIWAKKID